MSEDIPKSSVHEQGNTKEHDLVSIDFPYLSERIWAKSIIHMDFSFLSLVPDSL